jgi:hypothetical protein
VPTLPTQPKPSVLLNTLIPEVSDATSRKPVVDEGAVDRAATDRWQGLVPPYQGWRERDRRESGVLPNTHHGDVLPQHEGSSGDKSA